MMTQTNVIRGIFPSHVSTRDYQVPDRTEAPLGRFWELPMREYQLHHLVEIQLGKIAANAVSIYLCGQSRDLRLPRGEGEIVRRIAGELGIQLR